MGAKFSTPVHCGPGAHPVSCTVGTGSFLGVKRPGRGVNHRSPSGPEIKERVDLYLYSLSEPSWPVLGRTFISYAYYLFCLQLTGKGKNVVRAHLLMVYEGVEVQFHLGGREW